MARYTAKTYTRAMFTVAETPLFRRFVDDYWTEEERGAFCAWLAANPEAGDVVPGSGGCRKVRWARAGIGKRGGVRVIYFLRPERGQLWLLTIYSKSARENIPAHVLRAIRAEVECA